MPNRIDPEQLAREIAEIARTTSDPETGRLLVRLIGRLLTAAGYPPLDAEGGGEPPNGWIPEPECSPA
jgi:hypothetical protein